MTLDIGCKNHPRGDINVDIKEYPNVDCICNAEYLPFKDNSFEFVMSYYVLEHCIYPVKMILEMIRVSRDKVEIMTDDIQFPAYFLQYIFRKGFLVNEPEHKYGWTVYYIHNLLKALNIQNYEITRPIEYRKHQKLLHWLIIRPWCLFKCWRPQIKIEIFKEE